MRHRGLPAPAGSAALVEREDVLGPLRAAAAAASAGEASVSVVLGCAGAGRTSTLAAVAAEATRRGMTVLWATCTRLEQHYAFGVVGQLLRVPVRGAGADAVDPFAALDELYWAVVARAEENPVLLVVDDADLADEPSLRWLGFLVTRLAGLPVAVVLSCTSTDHPLLAQLTVHPLVTTYPLAPLSPTGAASLLREASGVAIPDELALRCHAATGGNPLYLSLLARGIGAGFGDRVDAALSDTAPPLPSIILRAVLARLHALGEDVVSVARAVAVLDTDATLELVAVVAVLAPEAALAAAAAAAQAGVLRVDSPLVFEQRITRCAVYEELPLPERSALHRAAARALAGSGAPPERVAVQLVATEPGDDLWVVETLMAAARDASARGAPDTACSYLLRALREPLAQGSARLLLELGTAELRAGSPRAPEHLAAALAVATTDDELVDAARVLARALAYTGRVTEAVAVLERARQRLDDTGGEHARRIDVELVATARLDVSTLDLAEQVLSRCAGATFDPVVLAYLSAEHARSGTSAEVATCAARAALADGALLETEGMESQAAFLPIIALFVSDALQEAEQHLSVAVRNAQERGSPAALCMAAAWRSHVALRAGSVGPAGLHAETAMAAARAAGLDVFLPYVVAFLVDVLVERGELDEAAELWQRHGATGPLPPVLPANYMLFSRGCMQLARGDLDGAASDLLESGERQRIWRTPGVGFWPWRSRAALALHGLGQADRARELVDEELALAREFGAPRPIGMALHAAGLIAPRGCRTALLEEARSVLASSQARLEHARACVDLGAALTRANRRDAGVEALEEGLRLAARCGGVAVAARARAELTAVGASVRRAAREGVAALTISELRVAQLAAGGRTNREIAQALFVTPKTVETHLHHVFRKLGVTSRSALRDLEGLAAPADA